MLQLYNQQSLQYVSQPAIPIEQRAEQLMQHVPKSRTAAAAAAAAGITDTESDEPSSSLPTSSALQTNSSCDYLKKNLQSQFNHVENCQSHKFTLLDSQNMLNTQQMDFVRAVVGVGGNTNSLVEVAAGVMGSEQPAQPQTQPSQQ